MVSDTNYSVTVAVPSFNQGRYLHQALESIFSQDVPVEVFVCDAGSSDETMDVIRDWEGKLAGWRSHADKGQAAAINEGVAKGGAPYVCWLNSDDYFTPGALKKLIARLEAAPTAPMAYGRAWNYVERKGKMAPVILISPFSERRLARFCIVPQPATLIRRSAWEAVGGVDESLRMAMDYDLWWKLYKRFGPLEFIDDFLAVNREHASTKTKTQRRLHYREAMAVVKKHHGSIPWKWYIAQPYAVWWWGFKARFE